MRWRASTVWAAGGVWRTAGTGGHGARADERVRSAVSVWDCGGGPGVPGGAVAGGVPGLRGKARSRTGKVGAGVD